MRRRNEDLPAETTTFVGRRREVAALRALLSSSRLLTLTGAGGVGKTRLALRVVAESRRAFPDGVWFVELADLTSPALLPETVATALGLIRQAKGELLPQLERHLATRQALLVLDNCEHLAASTALLVDGLLRRAPGLRVVVTSRHSLDLPGERVFTVPPMSTPDPVRLRGTTALEQYDAVALLLERVGDHTRDFALTEDNAAAVAELCARLDGIPLAIELAAARLRTLSLEDVVARLEHTFRLLDGGRIGAIPRQQTLRSLIDWSYDLCSGEEQHLLARLSVFAGSFDLEAVESICVGPPLAREDVVDLLDSLVRKSMVVTESAAGTVRYRLLETVRRYASDRLAERPDPPRLHAEHRDFYVRAAERSAEEWCGPGQPALLAGLRADHANLRSAFECAIADRATVPAALSLAASLRWLWIAGGLLSEGRRWLQQALELCSGELSREAAAALWVDAYLALLQGDAAGARERLDGIEGSAVVLDDPRVAASVSHLRGMGALFAGDLRGARHHYEASLLGHERAADDGAVVSISFQLAVVHMFSGDHDRAAALCERAMGISRRHGERWAQSYALWALAVNSWLARDLERSGELARASLEMKEGFQDPLGVLHLIELHAWISASEGHHERSAYLLGAAGAIQDDLRTSITVFGPHLAGCHRISREEAQRALGPSAFRAAVAAGSRRGAREVVAEILGDGAPPAGPAVVDGPSPLTAREQEIAVMVAEGLSNREIAARLVVSTRTVDSHVQHILTKLAYRSRAQIAAWVVQRT